MLRKKEILTTLLLVVCCCSFACAETKMRTITTRDPKTGKTISKQVPVTPKEADPHENTSVLVEAFVVRVSTEALAEAGVNPIGQAPEGISILKILSCLDDAENGGVVSGAKVMVRHNQEAEVKNKDVFYVKREQGNSVNIEPYNLGKTFGVVPLIQSEKTIRLEATYSYSGIILNEDKTMPPDRCSIDWSGRLTARSGQPVIAGAVQNMEAVTFLILAATIQDAENTEK